MTPDVLDRLRRHDPAGDLHPDPPAELLERLVAEPRDIAAAPRPALLGCRPVRLAIGVAAAAALLAGVSAGLNRGASPDLAARAYAQTAPASEILHVVQRDRQDFPAAAGVPDTTGSVESWVYGDEAHTIVTSGDASGRTTFTSDQLLGADGVIRNHLSDTGETQTIRPSDGAEAREIIAHSRRDFVADFRKRYERGVLDDSGPATFEGRPARRYVVEHPSFDGREEYYLDAATGAPLGSVMESAAYGPPKPGPAGGDAGGATGSPLGIVRITIVVELIERLPATAANLAKVRER